jgi:hypothetical protein
LSQHLDLRNGFAAQLILKTAVEPLTEDEENEAKRLGLKALTGTRHRQGEVLRPIQTT